MIWPLTTPNRKPSQSFGEKWSANVKKQHTGVDLPASAGQHVLACGNGTIVQIGSCGKNPEGGDWGQFVLLRHDDNLKLITCYLHTVPLVKESQHVHAGDQLGTIKDLENQSHLHFGVWIGDINKITPRGALPLPEFQGKIGPYIDDPSFPSLFVDPLAYPYEAKIETLPAPVKPPQKIFPITRDLFKDCASGQDVLVLQQILNKDPETRIAITGPGSPGKESSAFGSLTEKAVQRFQVKFGISRNGQPGYGKVGPKTRAKLAEIF